MAIHVTEANLAQPLQLSFHIEQLVGSVFGLDRIPDAVQEFFV
jgi:hypothetical protein